MRKQHFLWTYSTLGIVLALYGTVYFFTNLVQDKNVPVLAIIFMIVGWGMLLILFGLVIYDKFTKKKVIPTKPEPQTEKVEKVKEEPKAEVKKDPYAKDPRIRYEYVKTTRVIRSRYDNDDNNVSISAYINKVGYGPVLEINGNRIRDMRNNAYYRIENNYVYAESGGLRYEINNNRIKSITGGQLYEISGSNINKVFGGFFISISGNTLSKYDNSKRYELTRSLPNKYLLIVTVLLFGE